MSVGSYKYDTEITQITDNDTIDVPTIVKGRFVAGDVLLGYGVVRENWNAKLYAGLNVQNQSLSPADPENPVQGTRAGLKLQGDIWVNPTQQTMLFALASYSTAFRTYYATLKTGYDVFGVQTFIGPELIAQGNARYDQWRAGAHITGITLSKNVELGFSGGYLHSSDVGPGVYGKIDLSFEF